MNALLQEHPDLKELLAENPEIKLYKVVNSENEVIEQWEVNNDGDWTNVTEAVKVEAELKALFSQLDKRLPKMKREVCDEQ